MNYLNLFLLFLIAVYILQGFHKGFLISLGNTVGMAISWLVGFLFSPLLSQTIAKGSFYKFLLVFTEGSSHIATPVDGHLAVSSLSADQISRIVSDANLPVPFGRLVEYNMSHLALSGASGAEYTTVNQYFDYTVTNVVVNIIAFLIIYCIARIIISLLINAVNFASPLPVLKRCDSLIGGGVGVLRGFLGMFSICMIIPIVLISSPANITLFSDLIANSSIATFFYHSDFLLNFISGVI